MNYLLTLFKALIRYEVCGTVIIDQEVKEKEFAQKIEDIEIELETNSLSGFKSAHNAYKRLKGESVSETTLDKLCIALLKKKYGYRNWLDFVEQESPNITIPSTHRNLNLIVQQRLSDITKEKKLNHIHGEVEKNNLRPYYDYLASFFSNKILGEEALTLKDLYIEPKVKGHGSNGTIELSDVITGWLRPNEDDPYYRKPQNIFPNFRVVFGFAGQGKTSFCYSLMYQLLFKKAPDQPVFFFRLRELEGEDLADFRRKPYETIKRLLAPEKKGACKVNEEVFKKSLLILDGLDELSEIQSVDKESICFKLAIETNEDINSPYRVLVTSRRELDSYALHRKNVVGWTIQELSLPEQLEWLNRYNNLVSSERHYSINKETLELFNSLYTTRPLVRQPIILFILAQLQIYNLDNFNSAKVYELLFDTILDRAWVNYPEQIGHPHIQDKKQIRHLLQAIGLEMMRRDKSILNHQSLRSVFEKERYKANSLNSKEFRQLLLAFYFNENNQREDVEEYAIEFLHKTFGEYFAAEGIWRKINQVFLDDCSSIEAILTTFSELFGGEVFLPEKVIDYLIDIINFQKTENSAPVRKLVVAMDTWTDKLANYEFILPEENQKTVVLKALQNFYGYFSLRYRLQSAAPSHYKTKKWLAPVAENIRLYLVGTDLTNTDLSSLNLQSINISNSCLKGVNLMGTNLSYANFTGTTELTFDRLAQAYSLVGSTGIPKKVEEELKEKCPYLFFRQGNS